MSNLAIINLRVYFAPPFKMGLIKYVQGVYFVVMPRFGNIFTEQYS